MEDIVGRAPPSWIACSFRSSLLVHAAITISPLVDPDSVLPHAILAKSTYPAQSALQPTQAPSRVRTAPQDFAPARSPLE